MISPPGEKKQWQRATINFRLLSFLLFLFFLLLLLLPGLVLAGAILMGPFQSHVAHALHRIRKVSTAVLDRHVAHYAQHDQRCYLLCTFPRTRDQPHSVARFLKKTIPREGMNHRREILPFSFCVLWSSRLKCSRSR